MTDITPYFLQNLENLLEQAKQMKSQEPKSDQTRHWAVVYTDLEKVSAYAKTFLNSQE